MIAFLTANLGTVIISLALASVVAAIIVKMARDKRKGKCIGCDCNCENCPQAGKPTDHNDH